MATTCKRQEENGESLEDEHSQDIDLQVDKEVQTVFDLKALEKEYEQRVSDNLVLRSKLKDQTNIGFPNEEDLKNDDKLVNCYTGMPSFDVLNALYRFICPAIFVTASTKLTKFLQLLLVLMKLRLNLPLFDLAFRFKINESSVSRIFNKWIVVLSDRLSPLIHWPAREQLRQTMPFCYRRKYYDLRLISIIDCFEIFIEKPSHLLSKAATYSQYKSYNTAKYLIGIAPQGVISFVSDGYGGRVSDKYITEHSGFLNHLLPGDVVLADRGFNIEDSIGSRGASLDIPAFTRGKSQLSPAEVEETRKKANVRIHIERIIGATRQTYPIISATAVVPWQYIQHDSNGHVLLDYIVHVCCALQNLREGIIPFD